MKPPGFTRQESLTTEMGLSHVPDMENDIISLNNTNVALDSGIKPKPSIRK